jgi:hypothetical protein
MILPPVTFPSAVLPEYLTVPGLDPYSSDEATFLVNAALLKHLEANGPVQKFYDAGLIPDAVGHPTVVLEGLKRPNYENGLCFCTVPKTRWVAGPHDVIAMPPPPGQVFVVYAQPGADGFYVLDYDWRKVVPGGTGIPYRWQRDFERIVWPTS